MKVYRKRPLSFKFWAKLAYRNPTMELLQLNQIESIIIFN
jgi:hypothetical protein